jgi:DNA-binding response OmpR family regulator
MMPGMDGFTVCRELRNFTQVPVIMLTALDSDVDKITGLETGADDYVVKPFNPKELVARIKAILRRTAATHSEGISNIIFKNINIDLMRRKVFIDSRPVDFTPREYNLFLFLISNREKLFSREELLREVWGSEFLDARSVDVHIKYIREKLKDPTSSHIQTIWGKGYKFSEARGGR